MLERAGLSDEERLTALIAATSEARRELTPIADGIAIRHGVLGRLRTLSSSTPAALPALFADRDLYWFRNG